MRVPVSGETAIVIGLNLAVLGFVWNLYQDLADLRERMARLEGLFEGFTRREGSAKREVET